MTFEAILTRIAGPEYASAFIAPPEEVPDWRQDAPEDLRPKRETPYGYLVGERLHPCSREELVRHLVAAPATPAIWTPDTEALARPEDVPSLIPDLRAESRKGDRRIALAAGLLTLAIAALVLLLWWRFDFGFRNVFTLFGVLAATWFVESLYALRPSAGFSLETFPQARQAKRHDSWLEDQPAPLTQWLVGCLFAVAVVGTIVDEDAVAAAGLVKDRVWSEPYRLVTAAMLHVSIMHAWMNIGALKVLGRMAEAHAPRRHLPLVFLLSALGGTVASTLLLPAPSLGASGGILGVLGYLVVRSERRSGEFPDGFRRRMAYAVGATAVLGVLGFAFIDNAAHAGGLAAGLLLGGALVPAGGDRPEPAWLRAAGWSALAIVTAAAVFTFVLVIADIFG